MIGSSFLSVESTLNTDLTVTHSVLSIIHTTLTLNEVSKWRLRGKPTRRFRGQQGRKLRRQALFLRPRNAEHEGLALGLLLPQAGDDGRVASGGCRVDRGTPGAIGV